MAQWRAAAGKRRRISLPGADLPWASACRKLAHGRIVEGTGVFYRDDKN
ncbi:hypothetical protein THTE_3546 [Thermogutta terrifontis]|uniref:Uncharacterized protein n=1 Tax=Thermogutta terrifontis TaxID=1331910 RepID=A0A286RJL5_9BACT|nr:hypothetical protein THTE_3546 [Thermogutta terrifontis]